MEEFFEVKTLRVDYKCPKCNTGYMRPTGIALLSFPPQYPHQYNNKDCNYEDKFNKMYPATEYTYDEIS